MVHRKAKLSNETHSNRTFQNKGGVNKRNRSEKNHSNTIQKKKLPNSNSEIPTWTETIFTTVARHEKSWISYGEEIKARKRRSVELRKALSKPGTLRRRYDPHTQRTIFAPTRPNKRSREKIAEIDAELLQRTNRLGGGYQPLTEEIEETENPEEGELEPETEEDSVIMKGDNLPIVDLNNFNTDGKEAHYIQINHIVEKLSGNKKITEETIKKAEFEFMPHLKTLISKTAIDPELTRVRARMRREDRDTTPDGYKPVFDKLSIRWGLVFMDDQIVVPVDLRR